MMLLYDPESDVIQVELDGMSDGAIDHTENVSRGQEYTRGIDRGKHGEILGYNFMQVSKGIDLDGLPHTEALVELFGRLRSFRSTGTARQEHVTPDQRDDAPTRQPGPRAQSVPPRRRRGERRDEQSSILRD